MNKKLKSIKPCYHSRTRDLVAGWNGIYCCKCSNKISELHEAWHWQRSRRMMSELDKERASLFNEVIQFGTNLIKTGLNHEDANKMSIDVIEEWVQNKIQIRKFSTQSPIKREFSQKTYPLFL
jgi:hypothetical protein